MEFSVERGFPRLTWERLEWQWRDGQLSREEAESLLYAGTKIEIPDEEEVQYVQRGDHTPEEILDHRVRFYIKIGRSMDDAVAAVAQQLIVKHWLREVARRFPGWNGLHELLISLFIKGVPQNLAKPPYPRFVANYLLDVYGRWLKSSFEKDASHARALDHFAEALITWGLGHHLGRVASSPGAVVHLRRITELLENSLIGFDMRLLDLSIKNEGREIADFSDCEVEKEIKKRAALALLKIYQDRVNQLKRK
ncbi:MAG: hypothetical protein Q7S09_05665 [bacterium]|nr:hypothetical protein [bacterium]